MLLFGAQILHDSVVLVLDALHSIVFPQSVSLSGIHTV